jgi:hypothetical protein
LSETTALKKMLTVGRGRGGQEEGRVTAGRSASNTTVYARCVGPGRRREAGDHFSFATGFFGEEEE